jgi:hypothetical protein
MAQMLDRRWISGTHYLGRLLFRLREVVDRVKELLENKDFYSETGIISPFP